MRLDIDTVTLWAADKLLTGSVQGAVVIALVWMTCRCLPRVPPSVQSALWWLAALKLVFVLLPVPAIPIPLLPGAQPGVARAGAASPAAAPNPAPAVVLTDAPRRPAAAATVATWRRALIGVWLLVVGMQAVRLWRELRTLRAVVRRSVLRSGDDQAVVARLAKTIGLTRVPPVRESQEIAGPQVAGVRRPVVLVPTGGTTTLTAEERAMALCHELMHLRRHDLALGWIPALAERLFFFHPLARLAAREYTATREAACDAAVVRALGVSPKEYGRMLVRLGVVRLDSTFAAGSSSWSTSSLRRRLNMLQHAASAGTSRRAIWGLAAVAFLGVTPFQLVATTPAHRVAAPPTQESVTDRPQVVSPETPPARASGVRPAPEAAPAARPQTAPSSPRENVEHVGIEIDRQAIDLQLRDAEELGRTIAAAELELHRTVLAADGTAQEEKLRDAVQQFQRDAVGSLDAQLKRTLEMIALIKEVSERQRTERSAAAQEEQRRSLDAQLKGTREMMELIKEVSERQSSERSAAAQDPLALLLLQTGSGTSAQRTLDQLLAQLAAQQEALVQQQQALARQQDVLSAMQRRLLEETEQMREALDRVVAELASDLRTLRRQP